MKRTLKNMLVAILVNLLVFSISAQAIERKGKYDENNEFWLFIATSATNGVVTQAAMMANAGDAA